MFFLFCFALCLTHTHCLHLLILVCVSHFNYSLACPRHLLPNIWSHSLDTHALCPLSSLFCSGWDSQVISTEIARILLAEKAGFPVQMWPSADPNVYWDMVGELQTRLNAPTYDDAIYWAMGNTTNLVYLETWNENSATIQNYLFDKHTVASLGVLGTSGRGMMPYCCLFTGALATVSVVLSLQAVERLMVGVFFFCVRSAAVSPHRCINSTIALST